MTSGHTGAKARFCLRFNSVDGFNTHASDMAVLLLMAAAIAAAGGRSMAKAELRPSFAELCAFRIPQGALDLPSLAGQAQLLGFSGDQTNYNESAPHMRWTGHVGVRFQHAPQDHPGGGAFLDFGAVVDLICRLQGFVVWVMCLQLLSCFFLCKGWSGRCTVAPKPGLSDRCDVMIQDTVFGFTPDTVLRQDMHALVSTLLEGNSFPGRAPCPSLAEVLFIAFQVWTWNRLRSCNGDIA